MKDNQNKQDIQNKQEKLDTLRHSAAHLLAAAVVKIWPDAKPTIGPSIDSGFYYDFDFGPNVTVSDKDLKNIQRTMKKMANSWISFEKEEIDSKKAKEIYTANPYKLELIDELEKAGEDISFYKSGDFVDLCRGGHVDSPNQQLKYFKLLSVAGAYWRGDEKNKMLTRIYGTAFFTAEELDQHLALIEEAKKRDHRKIGKELDLYAFSDLVGKGLPLWTEKGATIYREIERYVVDEEIAAGYKHVLTPNIAKTALYKKSGHFPYYKDTMYPPMQIDDDELILRPMTCPHHFALYLDKPKSYKELPLRYAEMASLYRYEKSGELTGLIRVREFCLADSHNFVTKDQAEDEIHQVLDLIEKISNTFGLKKDKNYVYRLSLGDRNNQEKYYDAPQEWEDAEKLLKKVLVDRKAPFYEALDEAAFYGPKIDIQMKNVIGKEDTAFTVQYDFCLPSRFNLVYIDDKGQEVQPIVIHRSSFGAMERSIGFLIEHFAGVFPTWIAPIQAVIMPISEGHMDYSQKLLIDLKEKGIRAELWPESESLQKRVRLAEKQKIPYMLIVGDKEVESNSVSVRSRGQVDLGVIKIDVLIEKINQNIVSKSLEIK
jgi:threonyl-tRNA synthetase